MYKHSKTPSQTTFLFLVSPSFFKRTTCSQCTGSNVVLSMVSDEKHVIGKYSFTCCIVSLYCPALALELAMVLCKHITLVYDVVCVWHSTEEWCGGGWEEMPCMKSFELGKEMGEEKGGRKLFVFCSWRVKLRHKNSSSSYMHHFYLELSTWLLPTFFSKVDILSWPKAPASCCLKVSRLHF